jgi:hypothetical protein
MYTNIDELVGRTITLTDGKGNRFTRIVVGSNTSHLYTSEIYLSAPLGEQSWYKFTSGPCRGTESYKLAYDLTLLYVKSFGNFYMHEHNYDTHKTNRCDYTLVSVV